MNNTNITEYVERNEVCFESMQICYWQRSKNTVYTTSRVSFDLFCTFQDNKIEGIMFKLRTMNMFYIKHAIFCLMGHSE